MKHPILLAGAALTSAAVVAIETKGLGELFIGALPSILREVAAIVTAVGVIWVGVAASRREKRDAIKMEGVRRAAEDAAEKVDAVRVAAVTAAEKVEATAAETRLEVAATLAGIASVADKTHVLVNNAMGLKLNSNAKLARRIASMTKDATDIEAAVVAEREYAEHMAKQATVDAREAQS